MSSISSWLPILMQYFKVSLNIIRYIKGVGICILEFNKVQFLATCLIGMETTKCTYVPRAFVCPPGTHYICISLSSDILLSISPSHSRVMWTVSTMVVCWATQSGQQPWAPATDYSKQVPFNWVFHKLTNMTFDLSSIIHNAEITCSCQVLCKEIQLCNTHNNQAFFCWKAWRTVCHYHAYVCFVCAWSAIAAAHYVAIFKLQNVMCVYHPIWLGLV